MAPWLLASAAWAQEAAQSRREHILYLPSERIEDPQIARRSVQFGAGGAQTFVLSMGKSAAFPKANRQLLVV